MSRRLHLAGPEVQVVVPDDTDSQKAYVLVDGKMLPNILGVSWDLGIENGADGIPVTVVRLLGVEWVTGDAADKLNGQDGGRA